MEETHKTDKATTTSKMWYKCTQTHYGIIRCTYVSVCFKSAKVTHTILPQIREISKQQRGDITCALGQASAMPWQMSASAGFLLACIHIYIQTHVFVWPAMMYIFAFILATVQMKIII